MLVMVFGILNYISIHDKPENTFKKLFYNSSPVKIRFSFKGLKQYATISNIRP